MNSAAPAPSSASRSRRDLKWPTKLQTHRQGRQLPATSHPYPNPNPSPSSKPGSLGSITASPQASDSLIRRLGRATLLRWNTPKAQPPSAAKIIRASVRLRRLHSCGDCPRNSYQAPQAAERTADKSMNLEKVTCEFSLYGCLAVASSVIFVSLHAHSSKTGIKLMPQGRAPSFTVYWAC